MQYRVGVCSTCGAQFRVPATFEALKAKCKSCGGVVGVGPVIDVNDPGAAEASPAASGASKAKTPAAKAPASKKAPAPKSPVSKASGRKGGAPPVPARKPAPVAKKKPVVEEIVPKKKERTGPSMKERLLAQRKAELEAAQSAAPKAARAVKGAGKSAGKAAVKKVAQPAARAAARAGAKVAAATKAAGAVLEEETAKPRRGAGRSTGASSRGKSRSSARRPARGSRRGSDEDEGQERRGGRSKKSKSNPAPIVAGVAVLAVAGFAVWKFVLSDDEGQTVAAAGSESAQTAPDGTALAAGVGDATALEGEAGTSPATDEVEAPESPATEGEGEQVAAEGEQEAATSEAAEGESDGTESEASEKSTPEKPAPSGKDPASVDLTVYEDFGKLAESSDEEWAELQQLAATMIDPGAGAAGNRAKMTLLETGKPAIPAVLNVMKKIDVSTDQGYRDGDLCQKLMQDICNGRNFGWKYSVESSEQYFNKRVIEEWCKSWTRCKDDEKFWLWFAKLEDEKPSEAGGGEEAKSDGASRLKALDALDDE